MMIHGRDFMSALTGRPSPRLPGGEADRVRDPRADRWHWRVELSPDEVAQLARTDDH